MKKLLSILLMFLSASAFAAPGDIKWRLDLQGRTALKRRVLQVLIARLKDQGMGLGRYLQRRMAPLENS